MLGMHLILQSANLGLLACSILKVTGVSKIDSSSKLFRHLHKKDFYKEIYM